MVAGYNIYKIITLRDKIMESMTIHVGTTPTGTEFDRFVDDLFLLLPEGMRYQVVQESTLYLLGVELTKKSIHDLAWRLAGNIDRLKEGKAVYPWSGQAEPEWMPVQILSADKTKTWKGEWGYRYKLRVLAGSACPLVFYKVWPSKVCSFLARKLGFSAAWKDRPYRDGHELVSMRFMAEIDPKLCRDQSPGFDNVNCTGALEKWNKDILGARSHLDPPCPYSFTHFCYQCPLGYDRCKAGTHPKTYELKMCLMCNEETWHDPGYSDTCVMCKENVRRD